MRIFKKEFNEDLTYGMLVNECIITKVKDSPYGEYMILRKKEKDGEFTYMGLFPKLKDAILFVQTIEKSSDKYEYFCQYQNENKEGFGKDILYNMGQLGWELCGIDTKDEKHMYVYKRLYREYPNLINNPHVQFNENEGKLKVSFGKNGWGLSNELIDIGEKIKQLSTENHVYISNCFVDELDDVYDLEFSIHPFEK